MTQKTTRKSVMQLVSQIEHPEIARSLVQLGMIHSAEYNAETKEVTVTLLFPVAEVPESVRNYIISSIYQALHAQGLGLKVFLGIMDDRTRQKFMMQSQAYWKL